MLGNRNSQHNFAQIPAVNMARSSFDRSFTVKDTQDFDILYPIFVDEVIPGDTMSLNTSVFARLATQKVPIMDNLYMDFFYFFVPNRLVWDNWERFNGAQTDPGDTTDYVVPTLTTTAVTGEAVGTIYDKMGIPTEVPDLEVNSLPFRAYHLIWNEWFRDENLQNSAAVPKDDGPDVPSDFALKRRGKRKDYFTSCLPWPQKGPAVELPLGTSAPVVGDGVTSPIPIRVGAINTGIIAGASNTLGTSNATTPNDPAVWQGGVSIGAVADLSNATAATINQLRQAFSVQSLYELDARGGTRYTEILMAHFNVVSPDFRLQRPEYLGGGSTRINVHPVAQTAPTSGSSYFAGLGSFATASGSGIGFTKSFVEHGYVIGLSCARADITYQQGLNRMWSRSTRFDFFWPKLQELGEQAVLTKEIYAQGDSNDDVVFGYQERYAEYRYRPSEIHGQFRSTYSSSLDQWHMAEEFSSQPSLNSTFIVQNTPIGRAIITVTEDDLLVDMWHQLKHARPMMTYSVPSVIGRF